MKHLIIYVNPDEDSFSYEIKEFVKEFSLKKNHEVAVRDLYKIQFNPILSLEELKILEKKGLISAYHYFYNENQGEEKQKTFYLYRHLDKGYHIDHCFIHKERIKNYKVLDYKKWLIYSDHIPIMLEI